MQKLVKKAIRGFTLIELMIVVVIIGILASLAIYGVQKYVASAKTGEARNMLGAISKGAVTAFEGETMAGDLLAVSGSIGAARRMCASATLVPATVATVKGVKWQSSEGDWVGSGPTVGWSCLKFAIKGPQYYQYGYTASSASDVPAANDFFDAQAFGDLDGDADIATFTRQGLLTGSPLTLTLSPAVREVKPDE